MNLLFLFLIIIMFSKYFFNIDIINKLYKWLKIISFIILIFLVYKYYNNQELKYSIIKSMNKVDKVPVERTFLDINKYLSISKSNKHNLNCNKSKKIKRNVTNSQKKYIASQQEWKCGHCQKLLDHSYEVDHIKALFKGGDNSLENLVALCRNCHGIKTMNERLNLDNND